MSLDDRKTRAAILVQQHQPLVVDEVTLPDALDAGQVLVQIHTSGICGSQLGEIDGVKGPDRFLPHLLGHEACATVREVGPGVRHVAPGDRVVVHWRPGRGIESAPPVYGWRGGRVNAGWATTWNELAVVSENRLTPIDPSFDPAQAALFGCPVTTGLGVVNREARVRTGESVVVLGAGGVGLCVVQGAALAGASPIVAVDLAPARLLLAERLGATHVVDARSEPVTERIHHAVGRVGADVVVENTGHADLIALAWQLTQPQGRTVLVGVPRFDEPATLDTLPLHFGKSLTGSHGGGAVPEHDIPRYAALSAAGRLDLGALVTDRFALEDVNLAIEKLRGGEIAGRAILDVSPVA